MSVSDVHKTAVEAAARHYSDCNKKVQGLQRMAPQIPLEGLEDYVVELSAARAEEVAAARVLESLIKSA